jgi:hypothetical protein
MVPAPGQHVMMTTDRVFFSLSEEIIENAAYASVFENPDLPSHIV